MGGSGLHREIQIGNPVGSVITWILPSTLLRFPETTDRYPWSKPILLEGPTPCYLAPDADWLSQLDRPVKSDDNTLLQYMSNTAGYLKGGFTDLGALDAVAGLLHRNE